MQRFSLINLERSFRSIIIIMFRSILQNAYYLITTMMAKNQQKPISSMDRYGEQHMCYEYVNKIAYPKRRKYSDISIHVRKRFLLTGRVKKNTPEAAKKKYLLHVLKWATKVARRLVNIRNRIIFYFTRTITRLNAKNYLSRVCVNYIWKNVWLNN